MCIRDRVYPDGLLTLEWPETGNRLWSRAKGFNSEHNIQPGEGFPDLPRAEADVPSIQVASRAFRQAIQLGSIAVSKDATKPALSGVLLHLSQNFIRVVSTDGFRLAVVEPVSYTHLDVYKRQIQNIPLATNPKNPKSMTCV